MHAYKIDTQVYYFEAYRLEVCVPECHFLGTGFFPQKSEKFPIPSIQEHPLPGPVSIPPFGTGHFPSRLSPENETGIPEFESPGKFGKNSQNSVLDGKFPVGYWNMLYKSRPNNTSENKFLLGTEIWNKSSGTQTSNTDTLFTQVDRS